MDDLISREDALERLRSIPADLGRRELDDAIKVIENMPSEGKAANPITIEVSPEQIEKYVKNAIVDIIPFEQQWIPCSETADIPDHEVLTCDKRGEMIIGYIAYHDEQWICESETEFLYDPIAWMPLPEPYREETES